MYVMLYQIILIVHYYYKVDWVAILDTDYTLPFGPRENDSRF